MSDYRGFQQAGARTGVAIDQGLRAYMLKVYNYMAVGLGLTGVVAYGTYNAAVSNGQLTQFGQTLYQGPLMLVLMMGTLGLVVAMSFALHRMSAATAQLVFWAYAALNGVTFSTIGLRYAHSSITHVFLITAATFAAMSLYGYTTRRDLSGMASFLFMGLIGLVIASLINIFFMSSAMQWALSVIGVLVFTGFTAYDTQSIKETYYEGSDQLTMTHSAIRGALRLYLDFINLFVSFLQIFGDRR
jgi:FtsH-binding integral membrane protein